MSDHQCFDCPPCKAKTPECVACNYVHQQEQKGCPICRLRKLEAQVAFLTAELEKRK